MTINPVSVPCFDEDRTQLEINTGFKKDNQLHKKRIVGHAYLPVGSDTYEIKLMMFPKYTYFMHGNRDAVHRYTIYSKRIVESHSEKFLNPVGMGRLSQTLENHLELYFPLLGKVLFIDLIPRNV